jgi:hypothetical protein
VEAPQGAYKINWGAVINKSQKIMGFGVIVRDSAGEVLAAMSTSKRYLTHPTTIDAYAAWKVVAFGRDLGIHNILLEGDALEVVQDFQKEEPLWQRYGHLIENSKIILYNF